MDKYGKRVKYDAKFHLTNLKHEVVYVKGRVEAIIETLEKYKEIEHYGIIAIIEDIQGLIEQWDDLKYRSFIPRIQEFAVLITKILYNGEGVKLEVYYKAIGDWENALICSSNVYKYLDQLLILTNIVLNEIDSV